MLRYVAANRTAPDEEHPPPLHAFQGASAIPPRRHFRTVIEHTRPIQVRNIQPLAEPTAGPLADRGEFSTLREHIIEQIDGLLLEGGQAPDNEMIPPLSPGDSTHRRADNCEDTLLCSSPLSYG